MKSRSGVFKPQTEGDAQYHSFVPAPLPPIPTIAIDTELSHLLVQASNWIGKLESSVTLIPNIALFISLYVRKEALMSAQIKGTQCTLEDIFDPEIEENATGDVANVVHYIRAMTYALNRLSELSLGNRLLRETHAVLMGSEKTPGEFRTSQNWIGPSGVSLKRSTFIPPHPDDMIEALSNLEAYMNGDDSLNVLIQAAFIHSWMAMATLGAYL